MGSSFHAPRKDPEAVLDYGMDWSEWLEADETIAGTPTVTASPDGLAISQVSHANGIVSWRVSGGSLRKSYAVTVRITTTRGRIDERSVVYSIRNR